MRHPRAVSAILRHYPRIFLACHRRHTRDPKTGALVSERQVQILDHLDEIEPLSLSALAGHMGVTLSTMSIAVERLVNRGFVTRVADTADRRRVRLRLTESGARVCESQSVLDAELVDAMVAALPRRDRTSVLKGLALLARAAGESQRARSQRAARSA
jgi:DNA-binding MarR family transcriptional regulator